MLSRNQIKTVTALHQKKFRREENLFIAEGEKVVIDALRSGWTIRTIFGTQDFFNHVTGDVRISKSTEIVLVSETELKKISLQNTPQSVLAVIEIPDHESDVDFQRGLKMVLDDIGDPGNLGTLIRIADWFGIDELICSEHTVECFNPKVVQSAMGSLFRVKVIYAGLDKIFSRNAMVNKLPVYGTVLDGKNVFNESLSDSGFILIGSESKGISDKLTGWISHEITIPSYSKSGIDSLNAAVAAGIICSQFRSRK